MIKGNHNNQQPAPTSATDKEFPSMYPRMRFLGCRKCYSEKASQDAIATEIATFRECGGQPFLVRPAAVLQAKNEVGENGLRTCIRPLIGG